MSKDEMMHTPGPWKVTLCDDGAFCIEGMGGVLCQRSSWAFRAVESRANGLLMAAAPDLLAALQDLLHYARNCGADSEMLDRASDAIDKAKVA